jgi:hypothetical protein
MKKLWTDINFTKCEQETAADDHQNKLNIQTIEYYKKLTNQDYNHNLLNTPVKLHYTQSKEEIKNLINKLKQEEEINGISSEQTFGEEDSDIKIKEKITKIKNPKKSNKPKTKTPKKPKSQLKPKTPSKTQKPTRSRAPTHDFLVTNNRGSYTYQNLSCSHDTQLTILNQMLLAKKITTCGPMIDALLKIPTQDQKNDANFTDPRQIFSIQTIPYQKTTTVWTPDGNTSLRTLNFMDLNKLHDFLPVVAASSVSALKQFQFDPIETRQQTINNYNQSNILVIEMPPNDEIPPPTIANKELFAITYFVNNVHFSATIKNSTGDGYFFYDGLVKKGTFQILNPKTNRWNNSVNNNGLFPDIKKIPGSNPKTVKFNSWIYC